MDHVSQPAAFDSDFGARGQSAAVMERSGQRAGKQSAESTVASGPLPEHSQQKRGKQRRIYESEYQLEHVHDVVKPVGHVCGRNRQRNAEDGRHALHPEVVLVGRFFVDIRLVNVVCPHRVEGGDIAGHAGHEAGEQRGQPKPENSSGKVVKQHVGDCQIVVKLHIARFIEFRTAGVRIDFRRDESLALGPSDG